jgi:hypothetical protein
VSGELCWFVSLSRAMLVLTEIVTVDTGSFYRDL